MPARSLIAITLLLASAPIVASDGGASPVASAMRAHIEFLADDAMDGRDTGSRGHEIAANYVASQFRLAGLKPGAADSWLQRVPFQAGELDLAASRFSIGGQFFANRKEVLFGSSRNAGAEAIEAPVVFVGFGIDDAKGGYDDYRGLNVKGKIVAVLQGFPKGMPSDVGAHYGRTKAIMAEKRGAIGVITIRTLEREKTRPWTRELEGPFHPALGWTGPDGKPFSEAPGIRMSVSLHDKAAAKLFAGAKRSLSDVLAEADKTGGRPKGFTLKPTARLERTTRLSPITSPNVIGMLPGSDPALAGEAVLMMGHLDHIGTDPTREGDKIFNGAMDNASGIAALIEAARILSASPNRPRRTVLFAAVTGEEKGLLGADYLSRHPVGAAKIVGVVNLDMPVLLYDFKDLVAFGAEHSTLGPIVAGAGAKAGVGLSPDPLPAEGLFTRSDHYRFVQQGIPSVFLMTGFANGGDKAFADFLKTHYHRPSDDLKLPIDWEAAAKFARVNAAIAAEIANSDEAPKWYGDSFFGNVFAPNAAKAVR